MEKAFLTALRAGFGIGFSIISLGVLSLTLIISCYMSSYLGANSTPKDYSELFMCITGFALGASVVDPGIVADYVGDNVGDVVGAGSDFFASIAESVCATMLLSCSAPELLTAPESIYFPILVFSLGIFISILTVAISSRVTHGESTGQAQRILTNQPFVSAVLMTPVLLALCQYCLPAEMQFTGETYITTKYQIFACSVFGLWGGYLVGLSSEYFTSHDYYPVQEVAKSCHTGSATDIIYGLALGYMSTIFPILILVVVIYVAFICAGMYGIAVATCGMLSTIGVMLSVTSCGPIADNAAGLAKMCNLDYASIQTEDIHRACKVVSAHGRSFAIGAATITALAIFGAFIARQGITAVDLLQPIEFSGLVIGAMLPYAFSAQILQSVSSAAVVLAGIIVSGVQIGISFVNSGVAWDNAKNYIEGTGFQSDRVCREQAGGQEGHQV